MNVTLNVEKEYNCDVLVCGGGVAGFAAAVSAARNGADVILVESGGYLGGTATKGLVGPFMTCYDREGKQQIIKGLFEELVQRMVADGGAIDHRFCRGGDSRSGYRTAGHIGVTPFNVECLKRVTEQMCLESGVKLLYHTTIIGCHREDNIIKTVYAADSEKIVAINGKMFVDTTGNASLTAKAGGTTTRGDEEGFVQTSSMFFIISGVDKAKLDKHMEENTEMRARFFMDIFENGIESGEFPCGTLKLRIFENPDGTWTVNMAQNDEQIDELDSEVVTDVEITQRQQIVKIVDFLRKNITGLENITLLSTASDLGIRESRRMAGKTVFCLEDILNGRFFEDRIAVCANSVDVHQKKGVAYTPHSGGNYTIPLSCLVSKDIDNLLSAGKCLSADKYAFAAVRVIPPSIAMGQAAGVCASIAVKTGVNAGDVPYADVQKILLENGAYLG